MTKKSFVLISLILFFLIFTIAWASEGHIKSRDDFTGIKNTSSSINKVATQSTFEGTTFLVDYRDSDLNADVSTGSNLATFAATRGVSNPATYMNSSGVLQKTETSNVGRFTEGYYDSSGFTAFSKKGLMIEGASTNLLKNSGNIISSADGWTDDGGTLTESRTISAPDGTTEATRFTTGTDNDVIYQVTGATAGGVYTFSVWLKTSGSATIDLTLKEQGGDFSFYGSDTKTITSDWRRYTLTATKAADGNPIRADISDIDSSETLDAWGAQLELQPFVTSYIPTVASTLTRNAESLTYVISGNRTAATEGMVVKLAPGFASSLTGNKTITSTDTKDRLMRFDATNDVDFAPNITDEAGTLVPDLINDSWTANAEMTLGSNSKAAGSDGAECFFNGVADGTNDSATYTGKAWGTDFYIGTENDGSTSPLQGTIFSIAFFNRVLTAGEHLSLHNSNQF